MATEMFAETLKKQHSTRLITESRRYASTIKYILFVFLAKYNLLKQGLVPTARWKSVCHQNHTKEAYRTWTVRCSALCKGYELNSQVEHQKKRIDSQ
jgi:hypothetical protein